MVSPFNPGRINKVSWKRIKRSALTSFSQKSEEADTSDPEKDLPQWVRRQPETEKAAFCIEE